MSKQSAQATIVVNSSREDNSQKETTVEVAPKLSNPFSIDYILTSATSSKESNSNCNSAGSQPNNSLRQQYTQKSDTSLSEMNLPLLDKNFTQHLSNAFNSALSSFYHLNPYHHEAGNAFLQTTASKFFEQQQSNTHESSNKSSILPSPSSSANQNGFPKPFASIDRSMNNHPRRPYRESKRSSSEGEKIELVDDNETFSIDNKNNTTRGKRREQLKH